jgi:hypothetical protein
MVAPNGTKSPLTARLEAATGALSELEQFVRGGDLDARVVKEFTNALDHIRNTARAVQQWFGAQERSADPYAVLPTLAVQRVHRAAQLAKDLTLDLENLDVTLDTEGLGELYQAVDTLRRRLEPLFKPRT